MARHGKNMARSFHILGRSCQDLTQEPVGTCMILQVLVQDPACPSKILYNILLISLKGLDKILNLG
jgi:hypothetical protein